jgi:hypothetical protein
MAFVDYPVNSSNLAAVRYDADTLTLEVTFQNGSTYQYEGVTQEVVDNMINAESQGSYFYHNIRKAYPYQKIN